MAEVAQARRARRSPVGVKRGVVAVHVSAEERALIEARAHAQGVSMSRCLLDAALSPVDVSGVSATELAAMVEELRGARRALDGIANNLNQLTRYAHTISEMPEDFPRVYGQVQALSDHLDSIIAEVRR